MSPHDVMNWDSKSSLLKSMDDSRTRISCTRQGISRTCRFINSWRVSLMIQISLAAAILLLNFGVTVGLYRGFDSVDGVATVYQGSCDAVKSSVGSIHLVICILSTLLLGASNYCMQTLSSPTREEIDAAHAKRHWLSIGVPSIGNVWHIGRFKRVVWCLLALSSIPLHLLWNSAVIATLSSNQYDYAVVSQDFVTGSPFVDAQLLSTSTFAVQEMHNKINTSALQRLEVLDCIRTYSADYVSAYGNVLLVLDVASSDLNGGWFFDQGTISATEMSHGWLCGKEDSDNCNVDDLLSENTTHWSPGRTNTTASVDYCLAAVEDHPCRLQASPTVLVSVMFCNAVKLACFVMTFYIGSRTPPLVTNGDTVQSFLSCPDPAFQGRCLVSRRDRGRFWSEGAPQRWMAPQRRWFAGAPLTCWLATFVPALVLILTIFLICLLTRLWYKDSALALANFGQANASFQLDAYNQLAPTAASVVANIPQLLVSYIYLGYNAIFTYMLGTAEMLTYSLRPRFLGVQWPRGKQRPRGFLQLPFAYSGGLMAASAILHWLISESFFLLRVTAYDNLGREDRDETISNVGFSPSAIVFALSFGSIMLLVALVLAGLKKYPSTMPLAAGCSASIAAICQPVEEMSMDDLTREKLQWGVVNDGHATFSMKEVKSLIVGCQYL